MKNAVKENMRCFRRWMKRRTPKDRLAYEPAKNEPEKVKRENKSKTWQKIREDLTTDYLGTEKLFCSMAKNY